ncbi:6-pyruvoyl-tetrahydropterin synthase-related protein [Noviherbaspirillum galbum]|uniref:Membrane protein 6-pyruvoyl-tetrahydropterin synthase-related domain-containing protein n=1 Tax=Noviherbaspirillum galbum TaxID=2709383 RepID=A0A6B3SY40_9BURK|nr:6-pyruvoyl-tetrahydropterin synthase-related protein [Noviherbaspirillum galbum]NEX64585.1 hypothetical protein [Noviherbaspirillum galbum]
MADQVTFDIAGDGPQIVVTQRGNATAFFPEAFLLDSHGQWLRLSGTGTGAELAPGQSLRFLKPPTGAAFPATPLLLRFQDKAGVGFGQIAFLEPTSVVNALTVDRAENGRLNLRRTNADAVMSWLLAAPISVMPSMRPEVDRLPAPMPALPIRWRDPGRSTQDDRTVDDPGPGETVLLHEMHRNGKTEFAIQPISRQADGYFIQQPFWLNKTSWFQWLTVLSGLGAVGTLLVNRRARTQRMAPWAVWKEQIYLGSGLRLRLGCAAMDGLVALLFAVLIASVLHPVLLNSASLPTGGDTASHLLYAWIFAKETFAAGELTSWMPEVFGGFPLLSYYFPLPFIVTALLEPFLGFAAGLKWAMVLPALCLPGVVVLVSRHVLGFRSMTAYCAALGCFSFLVHEENAIWGGNLLGVLAGEFAYSYGMLFSVLTLALWFRAARDGRGWVWAGVFEALTGLCHGYALLMVGFGSLLLLIGMQDRKRAFLSLAKGHILAFSLLGGWLWPLLEMHAYTIPNDGVTPVNSVRELLPQSLWPLYGAAGTVMLAGAFPSVRTYCHSARIEVVLFFLTVATLALFAWSGANRIGLADLRFFPYVWLLTAIAVGWLIGMTFQSFHFPARVLMTLALLAGTLAWTAPRIQVAPQWAQWNFSGLEVKPQWQVLTTLFPTLSGSMTSPRLLFEHDADNHDLGSTRVLESLPLFLGGRPVLEGLYMESSLLASAIYQLQAEVSASPSSPLTRFPSGGLDPELAARHMTMLNADEVLLRSETARKALLASGWFDVIAEQPPFSVLRLRQADNRLVDASAHPWKIKSRDGWMVDSFRWFRSRRRLAEEWPVYANPAQPDTAFKSLAASPAHISEFSLSRRSLSFVTDSPKRPHLIRMAFHPRWQLATAGDVYLAAPGFLLVVPQEKQVRLVYGETAVDHAGRIASALACLFVVAYGVRHRRASAGTGKPTCRPLERQKTIWWLAGIASMLVGAALLAGTSAEHAYQLGWQAMTDSQYAAAAHYFLDAEKRRNSPAAQEESLFWAARATELRGNLSEAADLYLKLVQAYDGYWVPESLYCLVKLRGKLGDAVTAGLAKDRLLNDYPYSDWATKVRSQ